MKKKIILTLAWIATLTSGCGKDTGMHSPSGKLSAEILLTGTEALAYTVSYQGNILCDTASVGLTVDGVNLFEPVELDAPSLRKIDETYPVRGKHAVAVNQALEYTWPVTHKLSGYRYELVVRLYDDGFAYRFVLPGQGVRRVNGEAAQWRMPRQSTVWFAERNSSWKLLTYAGEWISAPADSLHQISPQGPVQLMPLVYETDGVYLAVTEAALYDYSGMRLRAEPEAVLQADFTEQEGFDVENDIVTPWRVLIVAEDLDRLVNTDIITNLNPPHDEELFADTSWIKPGRSLWSWWSEIDGHYMTLRGEKDVIDIAARMGYEYTIIDEGWERVPEDKWAFISELAGYGKEKGVGVFAWRHWDQLNDPADDYLQMRLFMDSVVSAGVKGLKIDFMNGEGKRQIDFTTAVLRNAAERRLLINFHGCQKPSGESRTYPNELTREGVRGIELNRITQNHEKRMAAQGIDISGRKPVPGDENQHIPASHNAALPFTRCITGPADYTPVAFSLPGNTTAAHQLATAYLIDSPLQVIAENPYILANAPPVFIATEWLSALPSVWDRTVVLPASRIGKLAAFARESGGEWYVAALNSDPAEFEIDFGFLPEGNFNAVILKDAGGRNERFKTEKVVLDNTYKMEVLLPENSGTVIRITKPEE